MKAINETTGKSIAGNIVAARTLFSRMKGLLGRDTFPKGEGLLIQPCKGIHTIGMSFPIDVIYLDNRNRVVAIRKSLPPNRLTSLCFSASSVLELPVGTLDYSETSLGDTIVFV